MRPPNGVAAAAIAGSAPVMRTDKNILRSVLAREVVPRHNAMLKRNHHQHTLRNFRMRCSADSHKVDDKPAVAAVRPPTAADIAADASAARLALLLSPSRAPTAPISTTMPAMSLSASAASALASNPTGATATASSAAVVAAAASVQAALSGAPASAAAQGGVSTPAAMPTAATSSSSAARLLRRRSRITEIVVAQDVVFALTFTGVCAAYRRENFKRICYLNSSSDEVIRSLFYNKLNQSLIHVGVHKNDKYGSLRCRTTPIECIKRGKPHEGNPLFETETLCWPGFVEFDDVNGKVLTYVAKDRSYKVWDLRTYQFLYDIHDPNLDEIKISPGVILLIYNRDKGHLPLRLLDINSGQMVAEFKHLLHRNKKVDFIEQFNEKLLIKQENENLQIVDVRTREVLHVDKTKFITPSAFIFLHEKNLFLTFRGSEVTAWNFRGELVTRFDDHALISSTENQTATHANLYITAAQDVLISYCHNKEAETGSDDVFSINMSSILTGKPLGKIAAAAGPARDKDEREKRDALREITALHYNEERNEIITGTRSGLLHVWTP